MREKKIPAIIEAMEMWADRERTIARHNGEPNPQFEKLFKKSIDALKAAYEWRRHRSRASEIDLFDALEEGDTY